ncbi:MAG: phosphocholine cytidylyltransferase family protein [Bacteroidetes bacterium]|nr:phosphocholine cytidylyltransferase family protein [Bacteroidota bacterium]
MKAIILAAGRGTRLSPLTDTVPKCMVEYNGQTLVRKSLETLNCCGINEISIVGGYKIDVLQDHLLTQKIKYYTNNEFAVTNMVYSLFCAEPELNDDVIISYSDIIYNKSVVLKLIADTSPVSVVVDKKWMDLWKLRMENPLDDAESLKLDNQYNIIELGKKTNNYSDIQGQYIGLIKIRKKVLKKIIDFYHLLDKNRLYDGKDFNNMYMTTFLQRIIDQLLPVKAVLIEGGWLEIDAISDITAYQTHKINIG